MLSTKEDIRSALDAYRSHIAAQNRLALEIYIPAIANWVPNEDFELDEDEVLPRKLEALSGVLGDWDLEDAGVSEPTELLTRYEELVPVLDLDGVGRIRQHNLRQDGAGDKEFRARQIEEYFTVIEAALKERSLEEVRGTIAVPEELRILCDLGVDSLHGPGLGRYRSQVQTAFWDGPGEVPARLVERVRDPGDLESHAGLGLFDELVIAGGWEIGDGNYATCCTVFCRKVDEKEFAWRYTFTEEGDFRIFDTIPQLLEWYKSLREERLDHVRDDAADEETMFAS